MNLFAKSNTLVQTSRRWLLTLAIAAILALSAAYAPVVIDGVASTDLTPTAFACGHPSGGC